MQPNRTAIQPLQRTGGTTAILLAPRVANFVAGAGQPLPHAVRQRMEAAFTVGSSIHDAQHRWNVRDVRDAGRHRRHVPSHLENVLLQ